MEPPAPPARSTPLYVLALALALVVTPIIAVSQLAAHLRLDVVDDQMFGYYGWRIAHGATVYLDVWDNKPPGIYWINALGFLLGGDSYWGVIALCILALIAAHVAFFVIAASVYFPGAAAVTTALASFFITHARYQGGTNRCETYLVPCELVAVALYLRGWVHDRWWKWYLSGMFCGAAFLFKQVGLAAWGAMGLHTIICVICRDIPLRTGLRRCLLLLAGMLTTVGLAGAVLAAQGALDDAWFATITFNRAYFAVGETSFFDTYLALHQLEWEMFPILTLPILMAIGAAVHAILWRVRPWLRPADISARLSTWPPAAPRYMLLFGIWMLVAFYGAILSPHGFRHYFLPALPPLLLFGGYLINVLQAEQTLFTRLQQRAWVTAMFVIMGYFAVGAFTRHWEEMSKVWIDRDPRYVNGRWEMKPAEWEELGAAVAKITRPDEKIQCWSYLPGVYLHARRINACRFTTTEKLGHVRQEANFIARELHQRLAADPPAAFVLSANDYAWITGNKPGAPPPDELGLWLARLLQDRYEQVDDIRNIFIFRRKS